MTEFVTAYGPKRPYNHTPSEKSLCRQSEAAATDINFIINRFQKTGVLEHRQVHEGTYGDFGEIDFHTAMNAVAEAKSMFGTLPSSIRDKFDNDPGKFLDFANDPANEDGMRELGLMPPDVSGVPTPSPPTGSPTEAPTEAPTEPQPE